MPATINVKTPFKSEYGKRENSDKQWTDGEARTPFQRDRDRILHSTAFRRLQYKTQVFLFNEGDFYRTRMTHSLEVSQIARGLAQLIGGDENLCEAIALAHDIGHPPFGHAGEEVLKHLIVDFNKLHSGANVAFFDHNLQAFRIVTELEVRYPYWEGLNLARATLEGILMHRSIFDQQEERETTISKDLCTAVECYMASPQPGVEAQIVNAADEIAYVSHDVEDALNMGLLEWGALKETANNRSIGFLPHLMEESEKHASLSTCGGITGREKKEVESKIKHRTLVRSMINALIRDVANETERRLGLMVSSDSRRLHEKIRNRKEPVVAFSASIGSQVRTLARDVLMGNVYRDPTVMVMWQKAQNVLGTLFRCYVRDYRVLPRITISRVDGDTRTLLDRCMEKDPNGYNAEETKALGKLARVVVDYVSGMTDKYALDKYAQLTSAYEKTM